MTRDSLLEGLLPYMFYTYFNGELILHISTSCNSTGFVIHCPGLKQGQSLARVLWVVQGSRFPANSEVDSGMILCSCADSLGG